MSRIWSMMDIGKRSMMNSQTALQTTSHNIANKGTEGYSRQRVELQTSTPVGSGRLRIGTGAKTTGITRTNNPYLERQIETEGNELGFAEKRSENLARVEQVYNEQVNKGLNKFMADFFNAFRELSNNPESLAARTLVKESGEFLTKDFKRVHDQLTDIQKDIDHQLLTQVEQINEYTREIADLNEKVAMVEINGVEANDERDRRDLVIKKLSNLVNINYGENESGQVSITAGDSAILVTGFSQRDIVARATPAGPNKREGSIDLFYSATKTGTPMNITSQMRGGAVGGLISVRDVTVNSLINRMDQMAFGLATEVNKAHFQGFDRYDQKGNLFFHQPTEVHNASRDLKVSGKILGDVGNIAVAAQPGSPADNRIANVISNIQYKPIMNGKQHSMDDFYATIVGEIGIEASQANNSRASQADIVKQLKNIRESISGVSLDEETTKMIEFQKSFDASARLIRTADEMMDTVLNLKRY